MNNKHFNLGTVFGVVIPDTIERKSSANTEFINFQVNVSGSRCGSVRAFCRVWKPENFETLLRQIEARPHDRIFLKGFFGQYWDDRNNVFSTYTCYQWDPRESDPRAAFILRGDVHIISKTNTGQRMILNLLREGQREVEKIELWMQDEKFLDVPEQGQLIEVKGYLRQEFPEDDFGGSSGPVRAYVEQLRVL